MGEEEEEADTELKTKNPTRQCGELLQLLQLLQLQLLQLQQQQLLLQTTTTTDYNYYIYYNNYNYYSYNCDYNYYNYSNNNYNYKCAQNFLFQVEAANVFFSHAHTDVDVVGRVQCLKPWPNETNCFRPLSAACKQRDIGTA